ncbi:hypothetical protein NUW58_g5734 [Xylaria curta]|uniref:Uncharacterized protein n=1 Tax=Xylaria curta TaxID=42375 RepID=A0ACC1P1P5_9PEZI|nr:hypothetical protein NUW58_g5734 [Xylaria curta]
MSMASFTQLGELLLIVAENTHSRRLLYNACLVSRMFNMAFTPSLYRCLRWDASNAHFLHDESKLDLIIRSGRLSYTRIIIVSLPAVVSIEDAWEDRFPRGDQEGVSWWCGLLDDIYDQVNRALINLFAAARRLRSFACSQLALSRECIRTLSGLPDLRSLYYQFPFTHDFYLGLDVDGTILTGASYAARVRNYGTPPDDVNCKRLTRLSLINMCGELDVWKRWLVRVISESPQLKRLSLSIERQTIERLGLWSDVRVDDIECHSNIVQYISRELGAPLNLECLRLGDGLQFPAPDAICATKLAEAYISNRMHDMVDPDAPINRLALKDLTALSKLAFEDMNYPSMKSISQEASHTLAS